MEHATQRGVEMELVKVVNGMVQLPMSVVEWLGGEDELAVEVSDHALVLTKTPEYEPEEADEREKRRAKIRAESMAFARQKARLLANYLGEYVAMHKGQVIDHDSDIRALHLRVSEQLGDMPVLLKQVNEEPERELVFRSPRLERS